MATETYSCNLSCLSRLNYCQPKAKHRQGSDNGNSCPVLSVVAIQVTLHLVDMRSSGLHEQTTLLPLPTCYSDSGVVGLHVSAVFPAVVDIVAGAGREPGLDQLQRDTLRIGQ